MTCKHNLSLENTYSFNFPLIQTDEYVSITEMRFTYICKQCSKVRPYGIDNITDHLNMLALIYSMY